MANDCLPQVQACRIRVTQLGDDGVPQPGSTHMYVSTALVTLDFAWEVEAGLVIREKNACDSVCVDYTAPPKLLRGNLTLTLCTPDPQLAALLTDGSALTSGNAVGFAAPALGDVDETPVSIEVWAKRIRDGKIDTTYPYAWWVYPWVNKLRPNDHQHANGALMPSFVGEAYANANWYNGPSNNWPTTSDKVYQWMPTSYIPTAQCGYVTLAAS